MLELFEVDEAFMSAIERQRKITSMPFALRPLEERDMAQAAEIERDAFPTLFPPTSFRREFRNRMASYMVAWRTDDFCEESVLDPSSEQQTQVYGGQPLISRLFRNARSLLPKRHTVWEPGEQFIAGYVGLWYMVDEAHIVSIGVRNTYRGVGIGELLLIGAIEQATKRGARVATLEVRISNHVARNLYKKFGFKECGLRKGYYTDNREDALIMTTDSLNASDYTQEFRRLVKAHQERWGSSERILF